MAAYDPNDREAALKAWTRRGLIAAATGAATGLLAAPALGAGRRMKPSDRVNIAVIGAGGQGAANMSKLTSQNIVATADVDYDHVLHALQKNGAINPLRQPLKDAYDKAERFTDYRRMLDARKDIDAVLIATPRPSPRRCGAHGDGARPACVRAKTPDPHHRGKPQARRPGSR